MSISVPIGGADGPTAIFLLSGMLLRYIPLSIAAVIFGIGHIYVTNENAKSLKQHINT